MPGELSDPAGAQRLHPGGPRGTGLGVTAEAAAAGGADLPVNFEEMQNSGNGYYTINDNHISIEMIPFWSLIDIYRYLSINNNNVQW